ncbi:MAG: glycosyl transferase, group 1 [Actinomycetia bacterium]|nr:glycosyl transferase, group 1 [Actinomycetes bacterium]
MRVRGVEGGWDGLVVLVAGSRWEGVNFASHHVARALTQYAPVLYVDPALSPITRARQHGWRRASRAELRVVAPRLAVLTPLAPPFPNRPRIAPLTRLMARRAVVRAARRLGGDVHATLLFAPGTRLFGAAGERVRVYYAKDDFSAAADLSAGSADRSGASEEWAAQHADLVVAHSPVLMERWKSFEPVYVPNGVDPERFASVDDAEPAADVSLPRPIVGFVGLLSNRIDLDLLEAVAQRGHSLLLVGARQATFAVDRIARLLDLPNVQWVGPRPYDELPHYLRLVDVGIVPYTDSAFNRASFPLKTLEYLAAGRPVVATPLPAISWLGTDRVRTAVEPEAFADEVDAAIAEGLGPAAVEARRAFARNHSWASRVHTLATALDL